MGEYLRKIGIEHEIDIRCGILEEEMENIIPFTWLSKRQTFSNFMKGPNRAPTSLSPKDLILFSKDGKRMLDNDKLLYNSIKAYGSLHYLKDVDGHLRKGEKLDFLLQK
jgi:hypothetical protein